MASKKKTTHKKVTRRKTRIDEKFDIKLSKDVAGSEQNVEQTVDAPSAQAALQKMQATDPQAVQDAESVTVAKSKAGGGPNVTPRTQPRTTPNTAPAVESKGKKRVLKKFMPKGYESTNFSTPYSLGVPRGFMGLFESIAGDVEDATVSHRHGRIYLTATTNDAMDRVVEALGKAIKGNDETKKVQAEIVIRGILAK
jgi:hypothetical protein